MRTIEIGRTAILLTIAAAGMPAPAAADSDNYYCTAPGLLVIETGRLDGSGHVLRVIRFSSSGGLRELPSIPIPDFQVHGITCGDGQVEIEGWSLGYTVDFSGPGEPTVSRRPARREAAPSRSLGHLATPGVVNLESDGPPDQFQLVVAQVERAVEAGVETHTTSRLVHRPGGPTQPIADSIELFEGIFLESVD